MARQPKTRTPKKKFRDTSPKCRICGADKFLTVVNTRPTWQCSANINH